MHFSLLYYVLYICSCLLFWQYMYTPYSARAKVPNIPAQQVKQRSGVSLCNYNKLYVSLVSCMCMYIYIYILYTCSYYQCCKDIYIVCTLRRTADYVKCVCTVLSTTYLLKLHIYIGQARDCMYQQVHAHYTLDTCGWYLSKIFIQTGDRMIQPPKIRPFWSLLRRLAVRRR